MHLNLSFLIYDMGIPVPISQDLDRVEKGVFAALSKVVLGRTVASRSLVLMLMDLKGSR